MHHFTRFVLFTSRTRIFFFTSLLMYLSQLKILFTVLSESVPWPISFLIFVNAFQLCLRFILSIRKFCRSTCALHFFGRPLLCLFSTSLVGPWRFKNVCLPIISDISCSVKFAFLRDKMDFFSSKHNYFPFLLMVVYRPKVTNANNKINQSRDKCLS